MCAGTYLPRAPTDHQHKLAGEVALALELLPSIRNGLAWGFLSVLMTDC